MAEGEFLKRYKLFLSISFGFVLLIIATCIFCFYRITSANNEFTKHLVANDQRLNEIRRKFTPNPNEQDAIFTFTKNEDQKTKEDYTVLFRGLNYNFFLSSNDKILDFINRNDDDKSFLGFLDAAVLKSYDEIIKDSGFCISKKLGSYMRPSLPVCRYRKFLFTLESKKQEFEQGNVLLIFKKDVFYIVPSSNLEDYVKEGVDQFKVAGEHEKDNINILILRNEKEASSGSKKQ
ncbi:hypothetical protein M153_3190004024 [Pseudoloma neurophilia]|uniref:Uncharacterized protein n=1 Tax=Pseudoloma neurophilia TaxID=146866 RepID=A0A0R0LYP8_9MICR|nr:hypothetical protein M153_3190004024 [Pseudoloma neurophilia]